MRAACRGDASNLVRPGAAAAAAAGGSRVEVKHTKVYPAAFTRLDLEMCCLMFLVVLG